MRSGRRSAGRFEYPTEGCRVQVHPGLDMLYYACWPTKQERRLPELNRTGWIEQEHMVSGAAQSMTDDDNGRHGRPGGRHPSGSCSLSSEKPARSPFGSQFRSDQGSRCLNTSPDLRGSKSPHRRSKRASSAFPSTKDGQDCQESTRPSNPLTSTPTGGQRADSA